MIEKRRKEIETQKWEIDERLGRKNKQIKEVDEKLALLQAEEEKLKRRREEIAELLKKIELREEKDRLEEEVKTFEVQQESLLEERKALQRSFQDLTRKLSVVLQKEKEVEEKERSLEGRERAAPTPKEEKAIAAERWQLEDRRKEVEKERWSLESKQQELKEKIAEFEKKNQEVLEPINKIRKRIKEIEILLEHGFKEGSRMIAEQKELLEEVPLKEVREVVITEEAARRKEEAREAEEAKRKARELAATTRREEEGVTAEIRRKAQEEELEQKIKQIQEKAEEAKAKEAVTLKGPLSKEALIQKLTRISPKEKAERERFLARVEGREVLPLKAKERAARKEVVFRPVVKEPPLLEKIVVRILVLLLLAGILFGSYLILTTFILREKPPFIPESENEGITPEEEPIEEETPPEVETTPSSLIEVRESKILEFSDSLQVPNLFSQALREKEREGTFSRIVFRDVETKEVMDVSRFLESLGAEVRAEFSENIEPPGTLFIYSSRDGPRAGFAVEVKESATFQALMEDWEKSLAEDFSSLFLRLTEEELIFADAFAASTEKGVELRCLDSSVNELEICYALFEDLLFFTTSEESILSLIDQKI